MTPAELAKAETAINKAREDFTRAEGALEQVDKDLSERFGLKSEEEAEAEIGRLSTQLTELDRSITAEEDSLRADLRAAGIAL